MKLVRFPQDSQIQIGKVGGDYVPGLGDLAERTSMRQFLTKLPIILPAILEANAPTALLSDVELLAPIDDPQKFLAIGMNYKKHVQEPLRWA